ncbi:JmjC domain-containing protein [Piscinibacter gummiphilus]|uniref:Cupin domain-containing protein n=1 Tax=Piscinibacter gummiphilus TaxID=946333 RepID=A0ABZ0CZA4_9BURK|nr:cupin domain-containing protein [Piscinibacter gummiphilus]WOB10277.1 cupin domain-containing protein [Piscinibacter gummiphilus]
MTITEPMTLLGGLSPAKFMRRHWQKRPLLIRQAVPNLTSFVSRAELFGLAGQEGVESRVIAHTGKAWTLKHGPFARRALPPVSRPAWTLLVQGLDTHLDAANELLLRFRFVPDARLDDVMVSWASDGGGVGPHVDSYDVFLLQIHGKRRWRIAPPGDATLVEGVPLKILKHFAPQDDWVLEPGDMLYLPPGWGHDGVAVGECMTASIGFRAAGRAELRDEVLQRMLDASERPDPDPLYRDPKQPATQQPALIPAALRDFAAREVARWLAEPRALACALGEVLSEPKPSVWFDAGQALASGQGVRLDRRTRMLYDERHVFINGDAFRAAGRDATLMRRLADERTLPAARVAALSDDARELLDQWAQAGWLHSLPD